MAFVIVQHGSGPLVVGFLIGTVDEPGMPAVATLMRQALPWAPIIATPEAPAHPVWSDIEAAGAAAGASGEVLLVGFSKGCSSVRQLLLDGQMPRGVFCFDGTHASLPPAAWQFDVWRQLAAEARKGERIFVGTCTQQLYVERLPPAERFMATRHVLEQAIGVELPPGTVIDEGDMHVASFASKDIDGEAHIHQARYVLPDMLKRFAGPLYASTDTEPATPRQARTLGERLIDWMRAEKEAGVREDPPGSNTSPRIAHYFSVCRRRGSEEPLGIKSGPWCSAMVSAGLVDVSAPGEPYPAPRAAGVELEDDARENGSWRPVELLNAGTWAPKPGDIVICQRDTGWQRHVAVFVERVGDRLSTIGGNEANQVGVSLRPLAGGDEPLLGFIELAR